MKSILFSLLAMAQITLCTAQQKPKGSIAMTSKVYSENNEIMDLMRFENINYFKTLFKGDSLKNKKFTITAKQFWKGKLSKTDTLLNTSIFEYVGVNKTDSLPLRVISKTQGKNIEVKFIFDRFEVPHTFKGLKTSDYSLRDFGTDLPIEPNKPFYAFAYILPYEKDGGKYWCAVESSGKDIETWGKEFGIKHYILFEMNFIE
ncbi:hypothetical protein AM493_17690 [Flavobacterium akiainvivens]|uniref:Uncharacterized protein n=1 Tax=Flavobacterium akiainvivens TaxID=1202724 RepID=A0A0M8MJT9_9FLAO|nr:hypothetical protein [Flavobacterium akiainvivens]KOS07671.1 hypothetical protein AM493_17690 [Flavobacterium akiainvivens]SFQ23923.1 hypothetical protein SAMN05444144_102119 [Flavobacterium akiainvivens]